MYKAIKLTHSILLGLVCIFSELLIADDVQLVGQNEEQSNFEFDLKIVAAFHTNYTVYKGDEADRPGFSFALVPSINFYDFFLEAPNYRISSITGDFSIGYHAWQGNDWSLDIIGGSYIGGINIYGDGEYQGLDGLRPRKDNFDFGVRYSHYGENTLVSVDVVSDVLDKSHESWLIDTFVGYRKVAGNWDLTIGLDYLWAPSKTVDYYVGVSETEVRVDRPYYKAGASSLTTLEFFAQYPISENWVFDTGFIIGRFGSEAYNSPLIVTRDFNAVLFALVYVF